MSRRWVLPLPSTAAAETTCGGAPALAHRPGRPSPSWSQEPTPLETAIRDSVSYAAIFDYPLTVDQLRDTLHVAAEAADIDRCCERSAYLRAHVDRAHGYFFPTGRADLIDVRHARERASRALLDRHRALLQGLCAVPYTRLVALSGSLAHLNGHSSADLDLFVITEANRVWSVAVAMVVLAKVWRQRRIVCVNYVVSDTRLVLDEQDLFAANQVVHLRPLYGGEMYVRFLEANPFVRGFYPNATRPPAETMGGALGWRLASVKAVLECVGRLGPAWLAERLCRWLYGWYLRRQAHSWSSPGQVRLENNCLKLHTHSHRRRVMSHYASAVSGSAMQVRGVEVEGVRSDRPDDESSHLVR